MSKIEKFFDFKTYFDKEFELYFYYLFFTSDLLPEYILLSKFKKKLLHDPNLTREVPKKEIVDNIKTNFDIIERIAENSLIMRIFYNQAIFSEDGRELMFKERIFSNNESKNENDLKV